MIDNNMDFKKVLVVGNGFDINLGLKTSYGDYLQSKNYHLAKHDIPLLEHLEKTYHLNNWVDIELELKTFANAPILRRENMPLIKEHEILCTTLKSYLKGLDFSVLSTPRNDAYDLLCDLEETPTYILNFNYTNTVWYMSKDLFPKPKIKEVKMHGSCSNEIIFGVEDSAEIPSSCIFLKKSTHKDFKPINFSNVLFNAEEVIFFGYSLGESDHMYFKDFFVEQSNKSTAQKRMKILIHHYGETDYFQIHAQLDKLTNRNITGLKQHNDVIFKDLKRR